MPETHLQRKTLDMLHLNQLVMLIACHQFTFQGNHRKS